MKKLFFLLFLLLFSCESPKEKTTAIKPPTPSIESTPFDWTNYDIKLKPQNRHYTIILNNIQKEKAKGDNLPLLFENTLLNKIIPFWYGTPWDFNGHTNYPNEGKVACGYFVSTTLKHLGLNLNRYKLAQQLPIHEAKSLSVGKEILEINEDTFEKCFEKIKDNLKSRIYFIGLDASHVGFLLNRKGTFFFIHSNYGIPQEVVIELAQESNVLKSFSHFYITELSTNKELIKHWVTGDKISIVTE